MTTIFFVRHAESDFNIEDDRSRPLTSKGHIDCALVTDFLQDKEIDVIISSPYKRAVDTITGISEYTGISIFTIEDFRERKGVLLEEWKPYTEKQWSDFSYKLYGDDEECLDDVQKRNITALNDVIRLHKNKNIVIGTHGMALSTIINFYDNYYGFDDFMDMVFLNPWIVKMVFDEYDCVAIEKINLFE
jgi:2,3-bisphosphoglycerate-dependent phosphoglycerate mutase